MLRLLDNPKTVTSSDPYYDLFLGGYINPEDFVVPKDAAKVRSAMSAITEFFELLESNELLEEDVNDTDGLKMSAAIIIAVAENGTTEDKEQLSKQMTMMSPFVHRYSDAACKIKARIDGKNQKQGLMSRLFGG